MTEESTQKNTLIELAQKYIDFTKQNIPSYHIGNFGYTSYNNEKICIENYSNNIYYVYFKTLNYGEVTVCFEGNDTPIVTGLDRFKEEYTFKKLYEDAKIYLHGYLIPTKDL